jgi:hypothetical protein
LTNGCRVGLQLDVDAVRQAEQTGEFLEGGNVAQGDATALHQGQTLGVQIPCQNLETGAVPLEVDQFDRLALAASQT